MRKTFWAIAIFVTACAVCLLYGCVHPGFSPAQTMTFTPLYAPVGDSAKHKITMPKGTRHRVGNCAETTTKDGTPAPCKTGTQVQVRQMNYQQTVMVDGVATVILPAPQHGMTGVVPR